MSERLLVELKKRLPHLSEVDRNAINSFSEEYDARVTVNSFDGRFLYFVDGLDRRVVVLHADQSSDMLSVEACRSADVIVVTLGEDRMFVGWASVDRFVDADDLFLIDIGQLAPMPDSFAFAQKCAHNCGMWMDDSSDKWICFSCGIKIPFLENK